MKKMIVTCGLLAAMLVPAAARAQNLPPGKWWKRPAVVQHLGLTMAQQDQLDSIFRKRADALIDLRGEIEKGSIALRAELDRPQLDRSAIQAASSRVSEARGKLFDQELMLLVDMRQVLSADQWNRFRTVLDTKRNDDNRQPKRERNPGR
ncbi:MAG: periplasmic heavy metal sensor [Acidobacteriota bacterium]